MTGVYIKCDECGAELGCEKVPHKLVTHWSQRGILQDYARNLGWTGNLDYASTSDKCPECTEKMKKGLV